MWIDTTSYRRGEGRVPTEFMAKVGRLGICVVLGHIACPGEWVVHCDALRIDTEPLGEHCKTVSQAKHEAISIVRRRLESLSKDTEEKSKATLLQDEEK